MIHYIFSHLGTSDLLMSRPALVADQTLSHSAVVMQMVLGWAIIATIL